jgi:hypothetical protein
MGFGIAVDVVIATVSKFRDGSLSLKSWTVPITVTHIMFPAVGYYLFWGLGEAVPALHFLLGLTGFVLVALFIYEVVCEAVGIEPAFGISGWIAEVFGLAEDDSRRFIAILAVSWDALWSGPAKAAQAEAANWTTNEVFWSFFVAGLTVAVFAQAALIGAFWLRKIRFHDPVKMARFTFFGKYFELSVIGGFGVLSLLAGFGTGELYSSILMSALIMAAVFGRYHDQISEHEYSEAKEAVET